MNAALPRLVLKEYEHGFLDGISLSKEDLELAESLSGEDSRLVIEERKTGIEVKATSWVGVVRFRGFEVRVIPKLAGENLGLVGMLAFATGLDGLNRNRGVRDLSIHDQTDLFDLLALLFAESCERIVNGGLLYGYIVEEQDLPLLRGRLLVREQFQRRMGQVDRIECRYDEHSSNIAENKILAIALNLCARRVRTPAVIRKVRRLMQIFLASCTIHDADVKELLAGVTFNRLNQHYKEPIELAKLLVSESGIRDLFSAGETKSFAFLINMNTLFELFVFRFIQRALDPSLYQVKYQQRDRSIIWNANENRPYARVIPDLLIEYSDHPEKRLVIDTKYKLYDTKKISPSDVYQCFLYAYAYDSGTGSIPRSIILYPTLDRFPQATHLHVRTKEQIIGASILAQGFNIPLALDEIRQNKQGGLSASIETLVQW